MSNLRIADIAERYKQYPTFQSPTQRLEDIRTLLDEVRILNDYASSLENLEETMEDAYDEGFNNGFKEGFDAGYDECEEEVKKELL